VNLKKLTPNLMVADVNATIDFYREVLDFQPEQTVPVTGRFDWASMKSGDVEVMFQSRASLGEELPVLTDRPIGASLTPYMQLMGIAELYERLRDRAAIVQEMHDTFYGAREFAIRDHNGYILAFAESIAAA
jgi:uncharacterized glyoxalase superfamily protein PhnB